MKMKLLILFAFLIGISVPTQAQDFEPINSCADSIERIEDRFTGSLALHTSINLTLGNHFAVIFRATKLENVPAYIYSLSLIASGRQFDYLDCNSVSMLVDGKRFNVLFIYTPRIDGDGFVTETFQTYLTKEQFNKLAYASQVEYKICDKEQAIPKNVLCTGREISRMSLVDVQK